MKEFVLGQPVITVFLPLVAVFFVESKMNRLYNFGKLHTLVSHCLTGMVFANFWVAIMQRPPMITDSSQITAKTKALDKEYTEMLQVLGLTTYAAVIAASVLSFCNYRLMLGKTYETVSVHTGVYLCKAAMLVAGKSGPLLYTCMLA